MSMEPDGQGQQPEKDAEAARPARRRRILLIVSLTVAGIAGALSLSFWFGDGSWLLGAGAGIGGWLGVHFGNKKAREVDEYRREWLVRRAGGTKRSAPGPAVNAAADSVRDGK